MKDIVKNAVEKIREKVNIIPKSVVILGSGLGGLVEEMEDKIEIKYSELNLCESTVKGHKGQFVFGFLNGVYVCLMQGRVHMYEGYSAKQVVLPLYVLKEFGLENLLITNSAGGINKDFEAGDLMIIEDVINFTNQNPLVAGAVIDYGVQFIDMHNNFVLNEILKTECEKLNIKNKNGVYIQVLGPTYETNAEVRMFEKMGADAVGMSTVMEVIAGKQCEFKMAGISCITNKTGENAEELSHNDVVVVANIVKNKFQTLVKNFLKNIE